MARLNVGERNRAWFKPGPNDDQDGPYQVRFRSWASGVVTEWQALTAGTHPSGGPGFYVWVATADVPDALPGDVILAVGRYSARIRYTDQRLIDQDDVGVIDVVA